MGPIYCRFCGNKLEERASDLYNSQTGELETELVCINIHCSGNYYCPLYKRHNFNLWTNKCKCGKSF
jgi:hypothetical protein